LAHASFVGEIRRCRCRGIRYSNRLRRRCDV
jgi:hypothetical protein